MNEPTWIWRIDAATYSLEFQAVEQTTGRTAQCAFAFDNPDWTARYQHALTSATDPDPLKRGLEVLFAVQPDKDPAGLPAAQVPDGAFVSVNNAAPPGTQYNRDITVRIFQAGREILPPYRALMNPGERTLTFSLDVLHAHRTP